jgi:hypothetical protein
MAADTNGVDFSNLSTQKLLDMYGHCKHDMAECRRRFNMVERELLSRPDTPDTCMDPSVCSKLNVRSNRVRAQTFRYYRPHNKKSTVDNISSFLSSYSSQLQNTQWDESSIRHLSYGIGNYLWQQRKVSERDKLVFGASRRPQPPV